MTRPDALSAALDRLYGARVEDFVAVRRALVAELRAAGEVAAARVVAGAHKPTRTAWALGQVARRDPGLLRSLFSARDEAAAAHEHGDADRIRATSRDYRDRVGDVVRAVRERLVEAGTSLTAAQARRVGETLQAAAEDDDARALLLAGRLTRDVEVDDPFAGLDVGAPRPKGHPVTSERGPRATGGPARGREADAAARRHEADAAARRRDAEAAARRREAEAALERRRRAVEEARREVTKREHAAQAARDRAKAADAALSRARDDAEEARGELRGAEEALARARRQLRALGET